MIVAIRTGKFWLLLGRVLPRLEARCLRLAVRMHAKASRQAITGESYAKAFTETYCDPKNAAIRDRSKYDDLAKAFDSVYGTSKSLVKTAKAAPPYDPIRKAAEHLGPNHAPLHSLAVDHMRAHSGMSYE